MKSITLPGDLEKVEITDDLVRLSVSLEDAADLTADVGRIPRG